MSGVFSGKCADLALCPVEQSRTKPVSAPRWNHPTQMQIEPGAVGFRPPGEVKSGDHLFAMQGKEHVPRIAIRERGAHLFNGWDPFQGRERINCINLAAGFDEPNVGGGIFRTAEMTKCYLGQSRYRWEWYL